MSVIIVTFPAAPKVTEEAIEKVSIGFVILKPFVDYNICFVGKRNADEVH